ncbi:sensor histidine kinase [Peterkaempfera bronchialis]|uniref:histidine kinase n=1 Tax=Peterkaempfera bronchialis TaxID=2126346 RepID=A0A345T5V2_9ACTN|nr:sensor histidine kinase [Peterkaempfera bronchialis]AXI81357.1 sensor histidine kinase [Peterkaempfera bronchialis]
MRPGPGLLGAPFAARTWKEFLHLLLDLPIAVAAFVYVVVMISLGMGLAVTFLGLPVLAAGVAGARGWAAMERARAAALLGVRVGRPSPLRPTRPGLMGWLGAVLKDGVSWRNVLYCVLMLPWSIFSFTVSVVFWLYGWAMLTYPAWQWVFPTYTDQPGLQLYGDGPGGRPDVYLDSVPEVAAACALGVLLVFTTPWLIHGMANVNRAMVRGLLSPSSLSERVRELEDDRGTVVDTAAADLRRIERDLHDGAQARLVALAMDLGLAKEKLTEDPEAAAAMVDAAHGEVKLALQELRDLARGIHPAILTDRGLDAALSSVATRCTIPGGVRVTVSLPTRPASAIEGIAYFTATELLTNISKHSHAHTATLDLWRTDDRLMLQVHDDGNGGAQEHPGSGLAGLADRIRAVDGVFLIHSPHGGPTTITVELPWRD